MRRRRRLGPAGSTCARGAPRSLKQSRHRDLTRSRRGDGHHVRVSTHPFLSAAETRAAHLREIDAHMSALGMREVRLADVQREIPELEAAMAVYRRLSDGGTSEPVPAPRAEV